MYVDQVERLFLKDPQLNRIKLKERKKIAFRNCFIICPGFTISLSFISNIYTNPTLSLDIITSY